jgi:hypothetical protein
VVAVAEAEDVSVVQSRCGCGTVLAVSREAEVLGDAGAQAE